MLNVEQCIRLQTLGSYGVKTVNFSVLSSLLTLSQNFRQTLFINCSLKVPYHKYTSKKMDEDLKAYS